MASKYYGAAQFQTMLEQRHHDDSFFTEIIQMTNVFDQDIADAMRTDIMTGNTATLRKHYKTFARKAMDFIPVIYDGVSGVPGAPFHKIITDHTYYGMVPIKDDYSNFQKVAGYHELPDDDYRRIQAYDALDALDMDAETVIEEILDPEPVGAVGSPEFKDYEKAYNNSPELQSKYPTVESYNADVQKDQNDQKKQIADLTDIYIGIYATGGTIFEVNRNAIYFSMVHTFPQVTFNGLNVPSPHDDLPPLTYVMQFVSGNFIATNGWTGWSHIIRIGTVVNEFDTSVPKRYSGKSSHRIVLNAASANIAMTDGDPIHSVIVPNELELGGWQVNGGSGGTGMLEIHVQLPDINGVHVYGEVRVWDYTTLHTNLANNGTDVVNLKAGIGGGLLPSEGAIKITSPDSVSVPDGSVNIMTITSDDPGALLGFSADPLNTDAAAFTVDPNTGVMTANAPLDYAVQNVYYVQVLAQNNTTNKLGWQYLTIYVENTNLEPTPPDHGNPFAPKVSKGPDLVFFPIEYKAAREVPFFKRERFLRESVTLAMYNVTEVEVKWYEKGWFKVVMFIVAIVIVILSSGAGLAALLEIKVVATAAATIVISGLVAKVILEAIDNPLLAAAVVILLGLITGNYNFSLTISNLSNLASLAVEATQTYINKYLEEKLSKLQEEMLDWQEKMKAAEEELRQLGEQVGDTGLQDASDLIKYLASVVAPEETNNFFDRTTNSDNAIIDNVDNMTDVTQLLKLY